MQAVGFWQDFEASAFCIERDRFSVLDKAIVEVKLFRDGVYVSGLFVHPSERRKGSGRSVMNYLMTLADKHGIPIYLYPKAMTHDAMTTPQLREWYERAGFEKLDHCLWKRAPR